MNFPFYIAKRYLFSKKSTHAINLISAISVLGVAVATMALVVTLSVFNGFHDLVATFFTSFDPQIKVVPTKGKTAPADDPVLQKIAQLPQIEVAMESVEDQALAVYGDRQTMVTVKGIDDSFSRLTHFSEILYPDARREVMLHAGNLEYGIPGIRLAQLLGVGVNWPGYLHVYAPQREGQLDMANPDTMNGVFATICTTVLPAGMIGMVVAAMFSATMSTLAGDFNAIAAVFTNDFYSRMLVPNASQRAKMAVARISTLAVASFVVALAFFVRQAQGASDLLDVVNKMFAVFLPPISFPMMVGFLVRRLSRRSGLVGTLVGMAYGIAAFIAGAWFPVLREMVVMLPSTFAATAVGLVLGTIFLRDAPAESRDIDEFFRKANTPS